MNKFCFIDSSGIMVKDPFFGTGLLVVKNVGDMADKLNKNSQPAKERTISAKRKAIDQLLAKGRKDEVVTMLRNSVRFEMKFDNIRPASESYYERMIDVFFSDNENRFSAMIVNKENPKFDGDGVGDAWETYSKYAASLVVKEMENLPEDQLCVVVDEITRPRNKPLSLEDTILSKIRTEITASTSLNLSQIFGTLSIESHSNFLMQLSDLLLGAVMYDYKKKAGLVSQQMERRKEPFVNKLRSTLNVASLAQNFADDSLAYFTVLESI
ncbi:MAG: hypothetical protein NTY93_01500 [Candidatus Kaiserbacteria bacterium]|nr:hypothetical protein [Candidatus Kaiserbacteria bacterium]